MLELWSGDTKVFSFSPSTVLAAIGGNSADFGKPDAPYQGQNSIEPYAFVNFFATEGTTFDRIVFFESPTVGGYESDNHTVGFYKTITGNGVPEPTTWALMISGFGLVGSALRRRQQTLAPQVA